MRFKNRRTDTEVETEIGTVATSDPPAETGTKVDSKPETNTTGGNTEAPERKPLKVFSYRIGPDAFVHCSVWQREGVRQDGSVYIVYDCSIRKRYRDYRDGEWRTYYSFLASELYAVHYALQQASSFITELRMVDNIPF